MSTSVRSVAAEFNYLDDPHRIEDGDVLHYYADFSGSTNVRLAPQNHAGSRCARDSAPV